MRLTQYSLILITSLFLGVFYNFSFFNNVTKVYSFSENMLFVSSLFVVLVAFTAFLFSLFASKKTTKPILILITFVSAFTAYFMDTYHIVIDDTMIRNTLQTNLNESSDLFTLKLVIYVLLLGVIPSFLIYKTKIDYKSFKKETFAKVKTLVLLLIVIAGTILSFNKYYTSFFRENKPLRYTVNPAYWIYGIGDYINKTYNSGTIVVKSIGTDATIDTNVRSDKNRIIIMVLGEASRADRFSLNGYEKQTNPLLKNEDIINFSNLWSCGTSTAESVPCMFSIYNRDQYSYKKGISTENSLDVINYSGNVSILWRDNNSSSKGNAKRVGEVDYRTSKTNTMCDDIECRDKGMLIGLDKYIEDNKGKDIFIVLHQMGNHGPAYYKRYPKAYEKFTPVCETNQLENCTQEEVSNAYDNAILYTDYFLSKVINFLKPYSNDYETAMLYMADHGESLGENGIYLHGLPYFMAPDNQKHVGSLIWIGDEFKKNRIDVEKLNSYKDKEFSQDNLFHTLIGLFDIKTEVYDSKMDILKDAKK